MLPAKKTSMSPVIAVKVDPIYYSSAEFFWVSLLFTTCARCPKISGSDQFSRKNLIGLLLSC
jgi:hypothetical protein